MNALGGALMAARRPAGLTVGSEVTRPLALECDVVIIGSGAGGAVMAAELAEAGLDVVVLEEGGYHPTESFRPDAARALRTLYRDGGASMVLGNPPVVFSEGRCVGGSTVINGGMSWRTPERVLMRWQADECVDISAAAMERHFARVERRISASYQDPETIGRDNQLLKEGADRLGWSVIDNVRNQLHCAGTNNCAFGCPTGAKRSTLVSYLPRALAHGVRLYADCRVERVTWRGRARRVTGVVGRFRAPDGRPGPRLEVRAPVVVAACGAMQTPALLMRSGFRPRSRQLGRNLTLHPNVKLVALFDEAVKGWQGVHQAYQVRQFIDEGILFAAVNIPPSILGMSLGQHGRALGALMAQYDHLVTAGVLLEDSVTGRVHTLPGGAPLGRYDITEGDADRLVRGIAYLAELLFAAGARRVLMPFEGVDDLVSADDARALVGRKIPRHALELFTVHIMGTARMSEDRRRGVTNSFGEVYDAAGLFVSDASLFPSPVGVNPMETIMGLSTRNAEYVVENRRRLWA